VRDKESNKNTKSTKESNIRDINIYYITRYTSRLNSFRYESVNIKNCLPVTLKVLPGIK
jgi:hypothetical protein